MLPKRYEVSSISDLAAVSTALTELISKHRLVMLTGGLGAGKTTLIKTWMKELGCTDEVTSPTFSLINEYRLGDRSFYHMDMYRLEDIDEAINIGIEEYLYDQDAVCIIEWPSLILPLIDESYIDIRIEVGESQRAIMINIIGGD